MQAFTHHHQKDGGEEQTSLTRGWVMNLGWRYDVLVWLFDRFLLQGES